MYARSIWLGSDCAVPDVARTRYRTMPPPMSPGLSVVVRTEPPLTVLASTQSDPSTFRSTLYPSAPVTSHHSIVTTPLLLVANTRAGGTMVVVAVAATMLLSICGVSGGWRAATLYSYAVPETTPVSTYERLWVWAIGFAPKACPLIRRKTSYRVALDPPEVQDRLMEEEDAVAVSTGFVMTHTVAESDVVVLLSTVHVLEARTQ